MKAESGVDGEAVQRAICTGKDYGGKKWSNTEKQTACQRYEELAGKKIDPSVSTQSTSSYGVIVITSAVLLIAVAYVLYRILRGKKTRQGRR